MSAFDGKWKRVSATNVDALVNVAVGSDAEKGARLKAFLQEVELVEEFKVTAEGTTRKMWVNGELKRDQASKFGVETERETFLGKSKILGTRKADNVIEVVETRTDGVPSGVSVFTVEGNKITVNYTMKGVTCTRVYEKM